MQVGTKVQVGKISKFNKSAGWNKAVQVGILGNLLLQIMIFAIVYIVIVFYNKARAVHALSFGLLHWLPGQWLNY